MGKDQEDIEMHHGCPRVHSYSRNDMEHELSKEENDRAMDKDEVAYQVRDNLFLETQGGVRTRPMDA